MLKVTDNNCVVEVEVEVEFIVEVEVRIRTVIPIGKMITHTRPQYNPLK